MCFYFNLFLSKILIWRFTIIHIGVLGLVFCNSHARDTNSSKSIYNILSSWKESFCGMLNWFRNHKNFSPNEIIIWIAKRIWFKTNVGFQQFSKFKHLIFFVPTYTCAYPCIERVPKCSQPNQENLSLIKNLLMFGEIFASGLGQQIFSSTFVSVWNRLF